MHEAYPLSWPFSKSRTPKHKRTRSRFAQSPGRARDKLLQELHRLDAREIVVSTNIALRRDGLPYANQIQASEDPGVAVYFKLKDQPTVLACDRWLTVGENMYAICLHIDSIRGQDRWGVGSIAQAFAGYLALSAPVSVRHWTEVLGVKDDTTDSETRIAFLNLTRILHPDRGGSQAEMAELNLAYDEFKKERGL